MSSVFPGGEVSNSRNMTKKQQMGDVSAQNRPNRAPTDLTFAGKFNKSKGSHEIPNCNNSNDYSVAKFNQSTSHKQQSQKLSTIGVVIDGLHDSNSSNSRSYERVKQHIPNIASFHDNSQDILQRNKNAGHSNLLHETNKSVEYPANELKANVVLTTIATVPHLPQQTTNEVTEQKVPKKRGRKKGSKGVDSVIAKETSLSSQFLSQFGSSGCKKVKTTKELYAEIQNRKLGICSASTSPTIMRQRTQENKQTAIRIDSSCSELSLQSPPIIDAGSTTNSSSVINRSTPEKNANVISTVCLDSDSDDTLTSGISRDGNGRATKNPIKNKLKNNRITEKIKPIVSGTTQKTAIDSQLEEVIRRYSCTIPSLEEIEAECLAESVPCTCKLYTLDQANQIPAIKNEIDSSSVDNNLTFSNDLNSNQESNFKSDETIVTVNLKGNNSIQAKIKREPGTLNIPAKNEPKTKSIFDIDFDDDDDPLDSFLANSRFKENINGKILTENSTNSDTDANTWPISANTGEIHRSEIKSENDPLLENTLNELPVENMQISIYNIEEDPNCKAKRRLEIQTQEITKFHIHTLHNYFIPNVNGNWNDVPSSAIGLDYTHQSFNGSESRDLLDGNVVPKYGLLMNERIQKDLSNFHFTKNFQRTENSERLNESVKRKFLGVAQGFFNSKYLKKKIESPVVEKARTVEQPLTETKENLTNLNLKSECDAGNLFANLTVQVDDDASVNADIENNKNLLTISTDFVKCEKEKSSAYLENGSILMQDLNQASVEDEVNASASPNLSRRSSCCSNTSLKATQQQINEKLKNLPKQKELVDMETTTISRKRRRNKKKSSEKSSRRVVKCLKIAINGSIATRREIAISRETSDEDEVTTELEENENTFGVQQHLKKKGEDQEEVDCNDDEDVDDDDDNDKGDTCGDDGDDNDDDEEEDENEEGYRSNSDSFIEEINSDNYEDHEGSFHQVVKSTTKANTDKSGKNHIVLTIKKTPSKHNSPSHFSMITLSPKIQQQQNEYQQHEHQIENSKIVNCIDNSPSSADSSDKIILNENENQMIGTMQYKIEPQIYSEVAQLEKSAKSSFDTYYAEDKEYLDLFFPDELYIRDSLNGRVRDNVLNIRYCDSDWKKLPNIEATNIIKSVNSSKTASSTDNANNVEQIDCHSTIPKVESSVSESDRLDQYYYDDGIENNDSDASSNKSRDILSKSSAQPPLPSPKSVNFLLAHDYEKLPLENNGLLLSFNNIFKDDSILNNRRVSEKSDVAVQKCTTDDRNWKKSEQLLYPNRKCDVFEKKFLNNNNNISSTNNNNIDITDKRNTNKLIIDGDDVVDDSNLVRNSSSNNSNKSSAEVESCKKEIYSNINVKEYDTINNADTICEEACISKLDNVNDDDDEKLRNLQPHKEYKTGLRTVDVDVHDENGKNCARVQEFKEWYEVLQLHSYKNELLTVMPYVVLD